MKLTLRIENFDFLPDGGPLEFSATARGFEVGRDAAMDWTLPDPTRHVSSRHFEVVFRDRHFWLNDISTNGTFVYGQSMRVSSPLQLANNDRLQVGKYIIRVLIADPAQVQAQPTFGVSAPPPPVAQAADPFVVHHFVAQHHAVDQFGMQLGQVEAVGRVMRGQGRLAHQHGFCSGRAEELHIVGITGHKARQVARVVGVELFLHGAFGVQHGRGRGPGVG